MSATRRFRNTTVLWLAVIALAFSVRASLFDAPVQGAEYGLWTFLAAAPLAIVGLLRRRSSGTIARVLYETEQMGESRARLIRQRLEPAAYGLQLQPALAPEKTRAAVATSASKP